MVFGHTAIWCFKKSLPHKSILFSGLVSVQSTLLEVCFLTTAIFFPFYFCSHSDCCTASLHLWNMGKQHYSFIPHLLQNNSTPRFVTPYVNITYAFGEDSAHSPKLTLLFLCFLGLIPSIEKQKPFLQQSQFNSSNFTRLSIYKS